MERRHKLRHVRHMNASRSDRADAAADHNAARDQGPGDRIGDARDPQRRRHGQRHTDHAVAIARPARHRRRQPTQRHNEQDARDQISNGCDIGVHLVPHKRRAIIERPPTTPAIATMRSMVATMIGWIPMSVRRPMRQRHNDHEDRNRPGITARGGRFCGRPNDPGQPQAVDSKACCIAKRETK